MKKQNVQVTLHLATLSSHINQFKSRNTEDNTVTVHGYSWKKRFEFTLARYLFLFIIFSRPVSETTQHPIRKDVNLTTYLHLMWR